MLNCRDTVEGNVVVGRREDGKRMRAVRRRRVVGLIVGR